jgi:hypothetical protein
MDLMRRGSQSSAQAAQKTSWLEAQPVFAGLDPAIHPLLKSVLRKNDGCAGQARA